MTADLAMDYFNTQVFSTNEENGNVCISNLSTENLDAEMGFTFRSSKQFVENLIATYAHKWWKFELLV